MPADAAANRLMTTSARGSRTTCNRNRLASAAGLMLSSKQNAPRVTTPGVLWAARKIASAHFRCGDVP